MDRPYSSVVMISYNQETLVADAIRSVQAQDDPAWEIIAVDDGSTDGTLGVLRRLAELDPRIRVVAKENTRLPSIARNVGLALATGDVVSFLDADDIYSPGRFSRIRRAFDACPDAEVLFGDYRPYGLPKWDAITGGYLAHLGMATRYLALGADAGSGEACIDAEDLLPVLVCEFFGAFTLNVAVRRRLIERRGLRFDESLLMAEDHDFIVRALEGGQCIYVPEVLGLWLRQPSTISSMPTAKGHRDAFQVLRGHVEALEPHRIPAPALRSVRARLADHAFEWGYAAAQLGHFGEARGAYREAFRHRPGWTPVKGYLKALFRIARRSKSA